MQRLFSAFPAGSPGIGILFLRLGAGIPLIYFATRSLLGTASGAPAGVLLEVASGLSGILLIAGLWTPVAGGVAAVAQSWILLSRLLSAHAHPFARILLPVLGAALALLGPGAWSVDARLFGRKRMDVRATKRGRRPIATVYEGRNDS